MARTEPRFAYLLAGLLITLLLGPAMRDLAGTTPAYSVQLVFTATVIVAVFSLAESRAWLRGGVALAALSTLFTTMVMLTGAAWAELATIIVLLAFCALGLSFTLRYLVASGPVNANRIVGTVSVYLLAGVLLSLCNMLIFMLVPGSFAGLPTDADSYELIYFTFVTMTTLGYGDVTPVRPLAQALAYLTAVAGQFYIAILVAYLVGSYLGQRRA